MMTLPKPDSNARQFSAHPLTPSSRVDFVLVTALPEERDALLQKLPGYRQLPPVEDDIRTYFQADLPVTFPDNATGNYRIIVMCLLGMGRVHAATATADAIRRWRPRYILMVGIAGGIVTRNVRVGDILISDQVVDYELQKLTSQHPEVRWDVQRADPRLLDACNNYRDESWQESIQIKRPNKAKPQRHTGPIASGDKVIAFEKVLARYRDVWPKLIGVEMEAAGVATAAFQSSVRPGFFMVRGVSDLADGNKDSSNVEKWRSYACSVAASFAIALLKSGPVPLSEGSPRPHDKRVEIILDGEFSEFGPDRQQDMVRVLAALLRIDSGDIRILKAYSGSIVIILEMPDSAANHLYEIATGRDFRIMNLDIKSILVEGKKIINIDNKSLEVFGDRPKQLQEVSKWQTKFKAKDAHTADGKRQDIILLAYLGAVFISSIYLTAYFWFDHSETIVNWAGAAGILLVWMLVVLVLTLTVGAAFYLLFRVAISFFDRLYEREGTDSRARVGLRFFGIPPSPPPLRRLDAFKYPFVLVKDGKVDPKKDWISWLGGPARLLIFDGNALYVERGNKFSRVIGPSDTLPFLDATERVRAVVNLRPHVLYKPAGIKAWTKDGILVQMDVRLECQIGLEDMTESTSKGLLYPYGPTSVKKAVEKTPVRYDPDKKCLMEVHWPDKVWGSVQGALATYIFSHTLDELFLADSGADQVHSRGVTANWLESLNAGLKEGGTRLLSLQVTNVTPVDPEVNEKRVKYWGAMKQSAVTVSEGEARAHGILAHETARAQAERDLIDAIVDGLRTTDASGYDDQLVLALSGILDQSLKDNDLSLYMPGETLEALKKLREVLHLP